MDEVSVWLAQSEIGSEKLFARVLAQMQAINSDLQRPLHIKTVTINDSEREPMTPPVKYMAIDPTSLDSTTMGIEEKLPGYSIADDVLPESNPCSSGTRNDQTSTSHYGFLSKMKNRDPSIPNSRSKANCGTKNLSD